MRILLFILFCVLLPFDAFSLSAGVSQKERLRASIALDILESKNEMHNVPPSEYSNKNNNVESFSKRRYSRLVSKNSKLDIKQHLYFSGSWDLYYFHYGEIVNGATVDKDTGSVNGVYTKLDYLSDNYAEYFLGYPFMEAYFKYSDGKSKYDGQTQSGAPFSFKENLEIERFGLKIGTRKYISDKRFVYGYFDVGKRVWIRGYNEIVRGVLSYREKYRWLYFGLGLGARREIGNRIVAGIEGEFMYAPRSFRKMYAELLDGNTYTLGSVWGVELTLPLHYVITKRFTFDVTPYYTFWHIGKSNTEIVTWQGIPAGYAFEPESKTYVCGVLFGLTIALI